MRSLFGSGRFVRSCFSSIVISMAANERKRKLEALDRLRRRVPHVTQSALAGIIAELKRAGVPELGRRADMRAARDAKVLEATPYGPISKEVALVAAHPGKQPQRMLIACPLAMLWRAHDTCAPFREFLHQRLAIEGCSEEKPWNMVLYCDEVLPGDQLGGRKLRKFHATYYSFLEFGAAALSREDLWFTLTTQRSVQVASYPGKLAAVFGTILNTLFVDGPMSDLGFELNHDGIVKRMFIKVGVFIMDGLAHKACWHCKGDAGSKFCILDMNAFSALSRVTEEDGTRMLQCNARRLADLDLSTSADMREAVHRLEAHRATDTAKVFEIRQKALGFTYEPYNCLSDRRLDEILDVENQFMHDWMHMVFVKGVWNLVMFLVLEAIRPVIEGNIYTLLKGYLERWHWPQRFSRSGGLAELFDDSRRKPNVEAGAFKCNASEGLSLYGVVGHFLVIIVKASGRCVAEIDCYSALCDVIDCLMLATRSVIDAATILEAVETFLDKFHLAFGMERSTPKMHWLLHFSDFYRKHGRLITCWALERKHKTPKAHGADIRNTRQYERSVLHEVICDHLSALDDPDVFTFSRLGLIKPRKASKHVADFVRNAFELPDMPDIECQHSIASHPSEAVYCSVDDAILFHEDGEPVQAGQVRLNLSVLGEILLVVTVWDLESTNDGAAIWRLSETLEIISGETVREVICWTMLDEGRAKGLLPRQCC